MEQPNAGYRWAGSQGLVGSGVGRRPVLVADGVSVNLLPSELSRIQHVDYRRQDKRAAIDVLKALSGLPKTPLPDPLPEPPIASSLLLGRSHGADRGGRCIDLRGAGSSGSAGLRRGWTKWSIERRCARYSHGLWKHDDLYARIGAEIDGLLASSARVQPNWPPSAPRARSSSISALAEEATPRSKGRSILRGALTLFGGWGPRVVTRLWSKVVCLLSHNCLGAARSMQFIEPL